MGGPLTALPEINFNLDGTNYVDLMNSDENMLTINWADWDDFVRRRVGFNAVTHYGRIAIRIYSDCKVSYFYSIITKRLDIYSTVQQQPHVGK